MLLLLLGSIKVYIAVYFAINPRLFYFRDSNPEDRSVESQGLTWRNVSAAKSLTFYVDEKKSNIVYRLLANTGTCLRFEKREKRSKQNKTDNMKDRQKYNKNILSTTSAIFELRLMSSSDTGEESFLKNIFFKKLSSNA